MPIASENTMVQTVVTKELKCWLQRKARAEGRSLSNYVGILLKQIQENENVANGQCLTKHRTPLNVP